MSVRSLGTESQYVSQSSLKIVISQPWLPECLDEKYPSSSSATIALFKSFVSVLINFHLILLERLSIKVFNYYYVFPFIYQEMIHVFRGLCCQMHLCLYLLCLLDMLAFLALYSIIYLYIYSIIYIIYNQHYIFLFIIRGSFVLKSISVLLAKPLQFSLTFCLHDIFLHASTFNFLVLESKMCHAGQRLHRLCVPIIPATQKSGAGKAQV